MGTGRQSRNPNRSEEHKSTHPRRRPLTQRNERVKWELGGYTLEMLAENPPQEIPANLSGEQWNQACYVYTRQLFNFAKRLTDAKDSSIQLIVKDDFPKKDIYPVKLEIAADMFRQIADSDYYSKLPEFAEARLKEQQAIAEMNRLTEPETPSASNSSTQSSAPPSKEEVAPPMNAVEAYISSSLVLGPLFRLFSRQKKEAETALTMPEKKASRDNQI